RPQERIHEHGENADNQSSEKSGSETGHVKTVHQSPRDQEQERVDKKNADAEGQNNKREGEDEQKRLEKRVEEAEKQDDDDETSDAVVADTGNEMSAGQNANREHDPSVDESHKSISHYPLFIGHFGLGGKRQSILIGERALKNRCPPPTNRIESKVEIPSGGFFCPEWMEPENFSRRFSRIFRKRWRRWRSVIRETRNWD